jgi:hypothetical protein
VLGSKWLVSQLSRLGFSVGPEEVSRYKQSVVENEKLTDVLNHNFLGEFTQWMADNVDHNPATLDGKGSLHAMGVISATTSKTGLQNLGTMPIPRQKIKKVAAVTFNKGIPILPYIPANKTGLSTVLLKNCLN